MFNRIRNCFRFVCPRNWDKLQPTDDHNVRFCRSCTENVYLVDSDADFIAQAKEGHCVAKAFPNRHEASQIVLGRPNGFDLNYAPGGHYVVAACHLVIEYHYRVWHIKAF